MESDFFKSVLTKQYGEVVCYIIRLEEVASKMLATLKPDHPIWDSQVVRALNITVDPSLSGEEKIQSYVHAYEQLTLEIRNFIQTKEGNACIKQFDITFPNLKYISPFKKIDYYLWNIGK